ncbi:MAG: galactokinase [Bacteroidota bacterium]|nr:galactokinase [Bacteroidota bacterium]
MMKKYFAPGRVNLIGEHIDYNGGLVLPAALTIGIMGTFKKRDDNKIGLHSATHNFSKEIDLADELVYDASNEWTNYPIGIITQLKKEGHFVPPCDIHFESNLPGGSALSSSAAIEVLTAFMLLQQSESKIDLVWLADFCRMVENDFIGVKCGIMDQFAVALGKADNAILLNCATLEHSYIPIELNDYCLLVMNTKKPRSLIHSKYNERKAESDEALRILQVTSGIKNLCEATVPQLDAIKDEIIRKRALHVVTENLRVKESVKALRFNDLSTFGRLMNASHASLKNLYEVTGLELDTLAEEGQKIKGCLGARMTGGGFGGCAIAIVHKDSVEELKHIVGWKYKRATGLDCEIYESEIGDGVKTM